ncbi:MAG: transposase [Deltaproteobacteria bacterium]|uniref:Transposase n=1 Tax=Candidatus Desulfacyla euxinica TaxID=2841693 RepID=A0A8J6N2N1_9DELT|nr:transposase [Candidatus Desulfacyla euxinica]MBL7218019.1 transposase [Desulfobacteraceae bacterium]
MPRLARLDAPGVLHHVIIRGIERRDIFQDNKDRDNLLSRLGDLFPETGTSCYAWALLSNHAHFLLRTGRCDLSTVMRRLLTGYVVTFNHRHSRHGPLFQNRFKSIICQEDLYLKELVRYIHLNPLRARIVSDLNRLNTYKYCGHSALLGKKKCEWMTTKYVLSFFGKTEGRARRFYNAYVKEGVELGRRPELVGGGLIRSLGGWEAVKKAGEKGRERIKGDERILGDSDFVIQVLEEAEDNFERYYDMKRLGYDLRTVEDRVCKIFNLERKGIYSGSREKVKAEARGLFCYWAVRELGYGLTEIGKRLGMTQPGVGYAVKRGERIADQNNYLLINESVM